MYLKRLSLLLVILQIQGSSSAAILPQDIDCSKIEAPHDFLPDLWISTKNLGEEDFLLEAENVKRIVNRTKIFMIRCWAPFPVTMESTSIIKNKKHVDQVKNNLKNEFFEFIKIFAANSFFCVEPEEELPLEVTCNTTCDPGRFLCGVKLYTNDEGENLQKVFSNLSEAEAENKGENTHNDTTHPGEYIIFVVFVFWCFFVPIIVMWKYTFDLNFCN